MNGDRAENFISLLRQAKSVLACWFFFLLFFYRGIFFSFPFTRFSRVVFKRPSKFNLFILHRGIITIIKRVPPAVRSAAARRAVRILVPFPRQRAARRLNSSPLPALFSHSRRLSNGDAVFFSTSFLYLSTYLVAYTLTFF